MKKLLCVLLLVCLCVPAALSEAADTIRLRFEDGFSLSLPQGWVRYEVSEADAAEGLRYILGDGHGERFLYIRRQATDLSDMDALRAEIDARPDCSRSSALDLNGQDFASFIIPDLNASGCVTLIDGELLSFLFTPQDSKEYMLLVAEIMASFRMDEEAVPDAF